MKKSAKIIVIAAFIVSAILMTSCSFLFSSKPNGKYVYETVSTGGLRSKQVYEFRGNNWEYGAYSDLLGESYDEPWMSMHGTFTVDNDVATLVEKNTGYNIKITIKSTDNWKTFKTESGVLFEKKRF